MSEYREVELRELCRLRSGYSFKSSSWQPLGVPVVQIGNVKDGFLDTTSMKYVDEATAKLAGRFRLEEGDVVIAMTGYVGATARVKAREAGFMLNQRVGRIESIDSAQVESDYLYWALRDPRAKAWMVNLARGSAQPNLSAQDFGKIVVPLPPLDEQRRIAEVLGALDDLIDTDRRMAIECSDLAQSLWEESMAGSPPNRSLASLATIVLGGTPARNTPEFWGGDIPWLNSGKANDFRVTQASEFITQSGLDKSSTKMMPIGTTIVAITGATLGQVSRTEIAACGNQSLVGVYVADIAVNDHLYFAIRDQIDVLLRSATGGAQQHINKANVEELLVKWPSDEHIRTWHSAAEPLMKATADLLREAEELEKTRDELLPLLMSGTVRVRPEGVAA